jgi:hypothetical protein
MSKKCVACSGALKLSKIAGLNSRRKILVHVCRRCGGLHFTGDSVDALDVLRFNMLQDETTTPDSAVYFDVTLTDGRRLHGWFDPATRTPVQFG